MDEPRVSPLATTILGAAFAGLAAGSLGVLLDSVYGTVLGLAVAMPVMIQFGYGFATLDRATYFETRSRGALATDGALMVAAAAVVGSLAGAVVGWVGASGGIEAGVATGAAFAGGGAAFLWRASDVHGELDVGGALPGVDPEE